METTKQEEKAGNFSCVGQTLAYRCILSLPYQILVQFVSWVGNETIGLFFCYFFPCIYLVSWFIFLIVDWPSPNCTLLGTTSSIVYIVRYVIP